MLTFCGFVSPVTLGHSCRFVMDLKLPISRFERADIAERADLAIGQLASKR